MFKTLFSEDHDISSELISRVFVEQPLATRGPLKFKYYLISKQPFYHANSPTLYRSILLLLTKTCG